VRGQPTIGHLAVLQQAFDQNAVEVIETCRGPEIHLAG
jgi:hypothetical protein